MSQQQFSFIGQRSSDGTTGMSLGREGFLSDRGPLAPQRILNPADLHRLADTLVARVSVPCPALGLAAGDLVLVARGRRDGKNPHSTLAVKQTEGGVKLVKESELADAPVLGELVMALPGARGLRYIANLYPFGKGHVNRRLAD